MLSRAACGSLEAALERAVTRFDDGSPASCQIRYHFGFGEPSRRGKRLRSRLLLEVCAEEGGAVDDALDAACAIEIVHEFSLIHDDIEDGDRLRRGRETVWSRFGLAHGVNAGDALCAVAYLSLLDGSVARPAERTVAMTRVLQSAHLAMCAGQGRDIAFETEARVTMDDYLAMIGGKTAALFAAACELGALSAGSNDRRAAAYGELGRAYGIAFQIEDDLLGTWGDSATTGKPSGADLAKRKWAFPVVWALGRTALAVARPRRRGVCQRDRARWRGGRRDDRCTRPARGARSGAARGALGARRRRRDRRARRDRPERPRPRFLRRRRPAHRMSASAQARVAPALAERNALAPLAAILGVGLVLRLLFIESTAFTTISRAFEAWSTTLRDNPPWLFYKNAGFADYPPGYFLVLWVLGHIYPLDPRRLER